MRPIACPLALVAAAASAGRSDVGFAGLDACRHFTTLRPGPLPPARGGAVERQADQQSSSAVAGWAAQGDQVSPQADLLGPAVESFLAAVSPLTEVYKSYTPEFWLHWQHPLVGFVLLFVYGGYGVFLGWQTHFGRGDEVFPFSYGEAARTRHAYMMRFVFAAVLLEVGDGLVSLSAVEQPLLRSPHFLTACAGASLMALMFLSGSVMGSDPPTRALHRSLGVATMLVLGLHMLLGLQLGASF